ncbi:MAG: hypothetical protein ACPG5B_12225 [Chitinophagales bacterium]
MKTPLKNLLEKSFKDELLEYMASYPEQFEPLIQLALSNEKRYSARAAWLLSKSMKQNDSRLKKHISEMIHHLAVVKDGHQRTLMNILFMMQLNEEQEGLLFDICVKIWCKLDKIPSTRYTAMKLILQIAQKHQELYSEIELLTEAYFLDTLSHGIKKSIQKMIKGFKEANKKIS